jgi:hypothetical protein
MTKYTQTRIDIALASPKFGKEITAAIAGRKALSKECQKALVVALGSARIASVVGAAIASGAALTRGEKRRILIALADAKAGNELINQIQSTPTPDISL